MENQKLEFNKEKDIELLNDIYSVLDEGNVYFAQNKDSEIQLRRGKKGIGLVHIILRRYQEKVLNKKVNMNHEQAQKEITAISFLIANSLDKGNMKQTPKGNWEINLYGIQSIITKDKYGKFVLTGYEFNDTIEEARNSTEAVIATYGNTPEFLGVYAQVGAVLTSYNYNTSQSENLSRINQIQEQLIELEKENNLLKEKLNVFNREIYQTTELVTNKEKDNSQAKDMENYVITQERNGEISVLASSYKNAIFVGEDYLSDYETYNLEKVNNLLKDLQESNPDNEYRIMTEDDFRQTYLLEENKLSPTEYLAEKINASGINIHLSKEEMKAILEAGKDVQKLAVKYGTNQNIESENEKTFNGYGTYVVSVNEENARQLGIKIASRKYGGTFYINNQPLSQFLQEKNFSPYWLKRLEQLNTNSVDILSHEIMMANVNGNATLEQEQNKLSTILSLDLIEYKREQTYLYSVEIPDNDNTNYLLYNNPIGIDQATKINNELVKMGVEWRASRNDIGKNIYFELLSKNVFNGNQKAASEFLKENVGFVGMQMDNANYIIFNDKDMSINNRVQYMKSENGEVYGFTFDGEIYIDEDLVNSNVLAHEYTHIWDNYVQRNNPELWQKGMTCLKGTSLWYEITEDKNYENLRTDDEILSECHARIVGKIAEQVLERIAARDGELTKDKIIDWDKEVNEYVATELLIKPELGDENYISESVKAEYLKEFLSMPMKDLMNGVGFEKEYALLQNNGERKLLTPLGKKSELSEDEWNYAHSSDFKNLYGDWEQKIKQDFLLSEQTVAQLTGNEFSKKEGLSLTDQVEQYFNNINNKIESPFFGNVVLDREGADDSLAHGMGRLKAIAYAGVPDVIKNGVIIDSDFNHKNRGYNSYIIAAPVEIAKEKYICEVVLKQNKNETRFYLHEVTEQKKFLDRAFVTNLAQKPAHQGTMLNILDKTLSVNTEISCPLTANGEPERKFIEEYIKSINNIQKFEISNENINNDYTDPIEALEESYNTPLNPPTEEDIEAEKILHDKYIQDELDKIIENLQANGGLSDAAIEAEIAAQEEAEAYEEDSSYEEEEEPVQTFNDTNGNPHFPQEIVSILENFQKVESSKWNLPVEEKNAVFHLIQLTEIDKNDFENSLAKLQEYMNTEEFKREEENYAKIFTPILLTSLGQDYDKETQTFSSEKFSYKFSTDELKEEIPVTKGEIKSILDNYFTGGNIKLTQDFQNELIEKGLVNPEDEFILINDEEAAAQGTKIKSEQPFVTLNIPVENNGKTDFVQTKYYHVSALEEFTQETEVKNEENQIQEEQPKTIIPEFAMITQHGLKTYTNMVVDNYEEHTKSYLLKSQDGQETVRITENTLKELTSNEHQQKAQSFDENTKAAEKMIETQYKDFFEPRKNCANNFRHNLSVFCRKEANSPLDALKVANSLISQMPKEEKRKTKDLLNLLRKDGQTVNEVIIDTYHEAVKEVPLNEEYLNNKRYDKMIARPMYDTISDKGQKLDRDFNLKIGDSVKVTFKVDKNAGTKFSLKKENLFQECTIISSSKEANKVTLMDGNKSFYDVPRDTFLQEYARREKIERKQEHKKQRSYSMKLDIERG